MSRLKELFGKSLAGHLWEELRVRWYFKFVLPRVREANLEGVRLDLVDLPLKVRNRILNTGYEAQEKQMCLDFLSPDDAVLELGGGIGFIALLCQKKIGIRHYAVFEANPRTLELLERNFALNGLTPRAWNIALGREEGAVNLDVGGDFWEHALCPSGGAVAGETLLVPAAPLEALFKLAGFDPNVLIIDIEGAETLINFDPLPGGVEKIIIELHPHRTGAHETYLLVSKLIGKGFRVAREQGGTLVFLRAPSAPRAEVGKPRGERASDEPALVQSSSA